MNWLFSARFAFHAGFAFPLPPNFCCLCIGLQLRLPLRRRKTKCNFIETGETCERRQCWSFENIVMLLGFVVKRLWFAKPIQSTHQRYSSETDIGAPTTLPWLYRCGGSEGIPRVCCLRPHFIIASTSLVGVIGFLVLFVVVSQERRETFRLSYEAKAKKPPMCLLGPNPAHVAHY